MEETETRERCRAIQISLDTAVWIGRVFGFIIVGMALAVAAKVASQGNGDEGWVFVSVVVTPMGIGFIVLVGTEILSRMGEKR